MSHAGRARKVTIPPRTISKNVVYAQSIEANSPLFPSWRCEIGLTCHHFQPSMNHESPLQHQFIMVNRHQSWSFTWLAMIQQPETTNGPETPGSPCQSLVVRPPLRHCCPAATWGDQQQHMFNPWMCIPT